MCPAQKIIENIANLFKKYNTFYLIFLYICDIIYSIMVKFIILYGYERKY